MSIFFVIDNLLNKDYKKAQRIGGVTNKESKAEKAQQQQTKRHYGPKLMNNQRPRLEVTKIKFFSLFFL